VGSSSRWTATSTGSRSSASRARRRSAPSSTARSPTSVEAAYLNARIAERTFGWSELFDQLAEVLPLRVRLFSLSPASDSPSSASRATPVRAQPARESRGVWLSFTGVAESDEALLELIDNLFQSPLFDQPQLPQERRTANGIEFTLRVLYLPPRAALGGKPVAAPQVLEDGGDPAAPAPDPVPPGGSSPTAGEAR
jgi:hypothetical protein